MQHFIPSTMVGHDMVNRISLLTIRAKGRKGRDEIYYILLNSIL